jgi:hypothetical protein
MGGAILDKPPPQPATTTEARSGDGGWAAAWRFLTGVGRPLVLGLAIFAVAAGVGCYLLISLGWALRVRWRRRTRLRTASRGD